MRADVSLEFLFDDGSSVLKKHINLLKAIQKTGSITKAAEEVGISYKNAWDSLDIINNKSDKPLIVRAQGLKKNSGSELSEHGKKMIEIYDALLLAQQDFLAKICAKSNIQSADLNSFSRLGITLSARNQLNCEITSIKTGALNSQILARLSSGEELGANITVQSENDLNLAVGKRVVFIFKAPAVMLAKEFDTLNLSARNQLNGEVVSVKIGAVTAEVVMQLSDSQTLSAIISKESAMELKIGVGDKLKAIVKSSDIIIGV
ncbi:MULTISPECIES: TOBE domain-containing protein [unclassified Campylobacter]|uniref:TOBE domain-containing protein n=1 Tax=unclassified Campylobacter TaxID=2593542 RepID=UPI003D337613